MRLPDSYRQGGEAALEVCQRKFPTTCIAPIASYWYRAEAGHDANGNNLSKHTNKLKEHHLIWTLWSRAHRLRKLGQVAITAMLAPAR